MERVIGPSKGGKRPSKTSIMTQLVLAYLAAGCVGISAVILAIQLWPFEPAYIILNKDDPNSHFARQIGNHAAFVIGREFRVTRRVTLHIDREIVQTAELPEIGDETPDDSNGEVRTTVEGDPAPKKYMLRVELEATNTDYEPDTYKTSRVVRFPEFLGAGTYQVRNRVCWDVVPIIRRDCLDLPEVQLVVTNRIPAMSYRVSN